MKVLANSVFSILFQWFSPLHSQAWKYVHKRQESGYLYLLMHVCVYVCMYVYTCNTCCFVHMAVRREQRAPWTRRWLWVAWHRNCEPNPGPLWEQQALLTTEPSLQLPWSVKLSELLMYGTSQENLESTLNESAEHTTPQTGQFHLYFIFSVGHSGFQVLSSRNKERRTGTLLMEKRPLGRETNMFLEVLWLHNSVFQNQRLVYLKWLDFMAHDINSSITAAKSLELGL